MSAPHIACPHCATIQRMPPAPKRGHIECVRCGDVLERSTGRSIDGALACSLTTLILLFPLNLMAILTVSAPAGLSVTTHLFSGIRVIWGQGWPLFALVCALEAMFLPFFRFGLLTAVLIAVKLGRTERWIGPTFRLSEKLDLWAMADVLLIGAAVGWGRVEALVPVLIEPGGWALICAAMFTMLTRATLDKRAVWRRIARPRIDPGPRPIGCTDCDLVLPARMAGQRCPRCRARLHRRKRGSMGYAVALTVAAWALAPVSYYFPMNVYWKLGIPHPQTILVGVKLLFQNGYAPLGVLIFLTSIAFPIGKLAGLTWFFISIWRRSDRHLRLKTRTFRIVNSIGRWSNLDPFTLVIFVPMGQMHGLVTFETAGGATAFLFVVALSMAAAEVFDTRLIWDAADKGRRTARQPAPSPRPVLTSAGT